MVISIHALRTEGDTCAYQFSNRVGISIHALRTEGDQTRPTLATAMSNFYPRPPYGGRHITINAAPGMDVFLSTPSVRRATYGGVCRASGCRISIHALRTEGDRYHLRPAAGDSDFYPRPPYGGRPDLLADFNNCVSFLSTPSVRRATYGKNLTDLEQDISIHALRTEGDTQFWAMNSKTLAFLSTPSVRRATGQTTTLPFPSRFLSTPSVRRATVPVLMVSLIASISIHALRTEGDPLAIAAQAQRSYFYPRPPYGGRPRTFRQYFRRCPNFYPRPPYGGRRRGCYT